jgi:hypothetical protein
MEKLSLDAPKSLIKKGKMALSTETTGAMVAE